jgi:hypothetical protein
LIIEIPRKDFQYARTWYETWFIRALNVPVRLGSFAPIDRRTPAAK